MTPLFTRILPLAILSLYLSGCASISKGIAESIFEREDNKKDTRACDVNGPAFRGLESLMKNQGELISPEDRAKDRLTTKILMIHGIGHHLPGYSTRFSTHLTRRLKLNVTEEIVKEIELTNPAFGNEPLGHLAVHRFFNKNGTRELLFYELTWSEIIQAEKREIEYDGSEKYSYRRADINKVMKEFINNHVPDPMIYQGNSRSKIIASVVQSFCWMFHGDWRDYQPRQKKFCNSRVRSLHKEIREDDYAIVTHSLGSRIIIDSLQEIAGSTSSEGEFGESPQVVHMLRELKNKKIPIIMLANQLPLLQLGREKPKVTGQIRQYCRPRGQNYDDRLFKELHILAFSDPNDLLSYEIPPKFAREKMDSRICPKITNISINVAKVVSVLGLGDIASPGEAHNGYDNDQRVIQLIAHGIGHLGTSELVRKRCSWLETTN
jgi:hypothetical protein